MEEHANVQNKCNTKYKLKKEKNKYIKISVNKEKCTQNFK